MRLPVVEEPVPVRPVEERTLAWHARWGALYGAALGMLGGLFATLAVAGEFERIVLWRRIILGGALAGLLIGVVVYVWTRRQRRDSVETSQN